MARKSNKRSATGMGGTDFPDDLMQTQHAWNATCRALVVRASVVAPVLDARTGRPGGAASSGPRSGAAAVNRRPQHLTASEEEILRAIRRSILAWTLGLLWPTLVQSSPLDPSKIRAPPARCSHGPCVPTTSKSGMGLDDVSSRSRFCAYRSTVGSPRRGPRTSAVRGPGNRADRPWCRGAPNWHGGRGGRGFASAWRALPVRVEKPRTWRGRTATWPLLAARNQ